MRRHFSFLTSISVIIALLLSFSPIVHAENSLSGQNRLDITYLDSDPESPPEDDIPEKDGKNQRAVTFPVQIGDGSQYSRTKIFSITAQHVTHLLTSHDGNKSFYRDNLPSSAKIIFLEAVLHMHPFAEDAGYDGYYEGVAKSIVFGICYKRYDSKQDAYVFESVYSHSPEVQELGNTCTAAFWITNYLDNGTEYYSYVSNKMGSGYVYGTLTVYWAT